MSQVDTIMKNCIKLNTYHVPREDFEALGSLEVDFGLHVTDALAGIRIEFDYRVGHQFKEHLSELQQNGSLTPYTVNLLLFAVMANSNIELSASTVSDAEHLLPDRWDDYNYYRVQIEIESLNETTTQHHAICVAPTYELAADTAIVNLAEHSSELRWVCNGFAYCDLALKNYRLAEKPKQIDKEKIRESNTDSIYYFNEDKLFNSGDWCS
ncbi:hypothetical protein ACPV5U_24565 [Vibrio mediterranei]